MPHSVTTGAAENGSTSHRRCVPDSSLTGDNQSSRSPTEPRIHAPEVRFISSRAKEIGGSISHFPFPEFPSPEQLLQCHGEAPGMAHHWRPSLFCLSLDAGLSLRSVFLWCCELLHFSLEPLSPPGGWLLSQLSPTPPFSLPPLPPRDSCVE